MAGELSFLEFAGFLAGAVVRYEVEKEHVMIEACKVVQEEAKRVIGTYDYGWQELADSTKADRVSKGFTENDPLLRTGDMRGSIEYNVSGGGIGETVGNIGSDNDKAVWQELGTDRIPPRSFLGGAAVHKEHELEHLFDRIPRIMLP